MNYTKADAGRMLAMSSSGVSRLVNAGHLRVARGERSRDMIDGASLERYMSDDNIIPVPTDHPRVCKETPEVVALSFFSGALGLDLGMELAGVPAMLHCENDRRCRMTIEANRPDGALVGDVCALTAEEVRRMAGLGSRDRVDVVFGGPPCQAFSTAGARRAFGDSRGNVFLSYIELASALDPAYLVIENVRGLLSASWPLKSGGEPVRGGALRHVLDRLGCLGYHVSFELYNAANFGAAQVRERVVLIANRDHKVGKLVPTHSDDPSWGLPPWRTFADATRGLVGDGHHNEFRPGTERYLDMLSEGQCWKDLPAELQEEAMGKSYRLGGGKTGFYRRIRSDRPCSTLVTSPTMPATLLCHPTRTRPLSVEEYGRVQGFPDDWRICGTITDQYRQIGNAVPVALGEAIGRAIVDDMAGVSTDPRWRDFRFSRYARTSDETWTVG